MIMNRSKSFFNSVNELKAWMSTKSKVPNHYETLKVTQNCTQDDIKSAYYELSKKYHPDRNATDDAKRKFQNVSAAYEILGNFTKRKQYDRDLMARGDNATQRPVYATQEDPLAGFYKSRMSNYNPIKTGDSRDSVQFDFDEWTRAHYGKTLQRSLREKSNKILRQKIKMQHQKDSEKERYTAIVILGCTTITLFGLLIQNHYSINYDKDLVSKDGANDKSS